MTEIRLAASWCRYRDTPWDAKAFGFATREITDIHYAQADELSGLLRAVEARNRQDGVRLCYLRLPAGDRPPVEQLTSIGYQNVEHSYELSLHSLTAFYPVNSFGHAPALRPAVPADLAALQAIAAADFHYGRFAEDPAIPLSLNRQRQRNWLADILADAGQTCWVAGPVGQPYGFHVFRQYPDRSADMILTGLKESHRMLAGFFWAACLHDMAQGGAATARTVISAANLPMVNLYGRLGFRFDRLLKGMHKHYVLPPRAS